ncbi:MAG: type I-G CRISPR-associated protein Csb2 [Pseudonocardiaceae bacterium]
MSLTLCVDLPLGRFEAGADDPRTAEWPPHPARVHCALVAVAQTQEQAGLLRWLEQQSPPQVWAERAPLGSGIRSVFVVTNRIDPKCSSQFHPGRSNQMRRRAGSALATSGFALVWPDAQLGEHLGDELNNLARRVPYLGRADGMALLTATTATPELEPEWECFEPTAEAGGELELRVPYRGYTDALDEVFLDGGRAWEVARRVGYRLASDASGTAPQQPSAVSSPYTEMLTYAMPPGARIDGLQAGMVTSKLRTVVMGKVGDATGGQLPAAVSGHGADTIPHVAYLPLLDVAHPHARGHLMGVGVALPAGQPATRAAVLRSLRPGQPLTLRLPFGELSLQPASERLAAMADPTHSRLSPAYWMQRSRRWASVTPLVLDRFPRRPTDIAEEVAKACTRVGLPEPEDVVVGTGPMVRDGAALRRRHLARTEHRPRLFTHAVLTFPVRVQGAVLLGAQRYLGMGLFTPLHDVPRTRAQEATGA